MANVKISDLTETTSPGVNDWIELETSGGLPRKVKKSNLAASGWDFSPPTAASFSLQSSDATDLTLTDDTNLGVIVDSGASASAFRYAYRTLTTPASAWDMIVKFPMLATNTNFVGGGLFAHNPTSSNVMQLYIQNNSPLGVAKFTALGTYSSEAATLGTFAGRTVNWFRIASDGTTITFYAGFGPNAWLSLYSETLATFLNSSGSTSRVGFFLRPNGYKVLGHIPYFSLTGAGV